MSDISYHDKDRYLISTIIGIIIHIIIFAALYFFLNLNIKPLPDYSGPLYIELGPEFDREILPEQKDDVKSTDKDVPTEVKQKNEPENDKTVNVVKENNNQDKKNPVIEDTEPQKDPDMNDTKKIMPKEDDTAKDTRETYTEPEGESLDNSSTTPQKTPQSTPGPTKTSEPYDPGLEEGHLSQLDEFLVNGTTGEPDNKKTDEDTSKENPPETNDDSPAEPGGGSLLEWDDNQDRKPLITVEPVLPKIVSEEGLRLTIKVSFLLIPDGLLTQIKVVQSSGYPDVDNSITDALKKWKFPSVPGTKNVRGSIIYKTKI
ncbi:MAG: TonB family protein [Spirochaetales bacterium]|nr:TonB family protein [Spirochaetales bacterium]